MDLELDKSQNISVDDLQNKIIDINKGINNANEEFKFYFLQKRKYNQSNWIMTGRKIYLNKLIICILIITSLKVILLK